MVLNDKSFGKFSVEKFMACKSKVKMSPCEPTKIRGYGNGVGDDFNGSRPLGGRKMNTK
jgi:hypothetical protein